MQRSCLLLTFLLYVNYAAWLGAVCVGSRLFHSDQARNWVVLVAGSNGWENYRHQADVYHAYQIMKRNNISTEQIITFAYDDIANNPENPFMGKVFNDYTHKDVYEGVHIDYRGEDVTPDNFLRAMRGDKELEANGKKVLKSGPEDHVFVYFSDHGADGLLAFPEDDLLASDLNKTLGYMHENKMYKQMVLYVEACESGSMFQDILPSDIGIYVTTAANSEESSWATFCRDTIIGTCLADEYSYNWLTDSEHHDLSHRTLDDQFQSVKQNTKQSHVSRFGELPQVLHSHPSRWAHLVTMVRRMMKAETEEEHELASRKLYRALLLAQIVKETFEEIVTDVTTFHQPTMRMLSKSEELQCYEEVFQEFKNRCFTIRQVPEVAQYARHLRKLCKEGYETEALVQSVHEVCS
uniref:Hemoglobinase n=1 Tax=Opisthorchis viverrini TaxID=6198 RepID=Q208S4_OPIVI|nr:legumain [Opisthorchis viverrini]